MKYKYIRRHTNIVKVGNVNIGGNNAIVVQSMTTTPTEDTEQSVAQTIRIAQAKGEIVRLTAQARSQAENLANIKSELTDRGYSVPLVADIHFTSDLAFIAARIVDKVRINPGNFVDKRAKFESSEISQEQWDSEKLRLQSRFRELITLCKEHHTALRIGVNHGSLSDRIMSRYGNTPLGMVISAIELLEVCQQERFDNVVVSMKSSNVNVMVSSYRLLAHHMQLHHMNYPLHLGVTEAGEGQQGRIRSGVGIGTLLTEGLGDTIRVSLTEEPENEIPAALLLSRYICHGDNRWNPSFDVAEAKDLYLDEPCVVAPHGGDLTPEQCSSINALEVNEILKLNKDNLGSLAHQDRLVVESNYSGADWSQSLRQALSHLHSLGFRGQTIIKKSYPSHLTDSVSDLQIMAAADFGVLFVDRLAAGIWIESELFANQVAEIALDILQASRVRISRADIISCPGCGRTLYDLQSVVKQVKDRFSHQAGLKLAVMGCIVNGPGEMADSEFGYVGSGPNLVTLYHRTEPVYRNIPQDKALDVLAEYIEQNKK